MFLNGPGLYKKNNPNDSDNSSSHTSSPSSSSSHRSQKICLQKEFQNKDACDSVAKSLLTIDEIGSFKSHTIRSATLRNRTALTNHLNQSLDSAARINPKLFGRIEPVEEPVHSSCTQFLDILLTEPQLTPSPSSSSSPPSPLSSSSSSINFRSLPIRKRLKKSLSIKSTSSTIQYGVKILNRVFAKNARTSEPSESTERVSLSEQKMLVRPSTDLFLPSRKIRKLIPFNNGIKNHGNTCFMNCVLQSLFHSMPFVHFFFTEYEKTRRLVEQQGLKSWTNKQLSPFILSEHMQRMLKSLWQNAYDPLYSHELKQLIGFLNPTFAGVEQNDSHEFCIWLLDRLSQELTVHLGAQPASTSYIDKLFRIEFKSTVTCSKCNYKSSKLETDMMLSLPLPQASDVRRDNNRVSRCLLYTYLIVSSEKTLRSLLAEAESPYENVKSKFYIDQESDRCYKIPSIVHLVVENLLSKSNGSFGHLVRSKINPTFRDLRLFLARSLNLSPKSLLLVQMAKIERLVRDSDQIRDVLYSSLANSSIPRLYVYEMAEDKKPTKPVVPVIDLLCFNVYETETNPNACYSLPFLVKINRDCSYMQLSQQVINAQSKFLKTNKLEKFKNILDKLFAIYLVTGDDTQPYRISPSDELPLYIESVETALNNTIKSCDVAEHIRILIKWKSYEDISYCIREQNYTQIDYDLSKKLVAYDPAEYDLHFSDSVKQDEKSIISLETCFDMFTQCEELSDDNSWTCTKCKKQTNAYKKLNISSLPPILIIHLKRFFYQSRTSNSKLTTPVWFPVSKLDMSKYVIAEELNDTYLSNTSSTDSQYIYDLYAVCNHKGRDMANGHYTAYCKNSFDLKWYCFDDANCIPMSDLNPQLTSPFWKIYNNGSENICTENAYILFYKKRGCMENEKWWLTYVDRSLLDYDEYDYFVHHYDLIESKQSQEQDKNQKLFCRANFQSIYGTIKPRLESRDQVANSPTNYSYEISVNYYDETKRPRRVTNKYQALCDSLNSSPNKLNHSNSPSTASSSSKDYANSTILNRTVGSSHHLDELNLTKKISTMDLSDDYLKLPNDNEFIYNMSPSSNVYYPQSDFLTQSKLDDQTNKYVTTVKRSVNSNPSADRYRNPNSIETTI
ncbi:ubiquitin carboxyl-terminal hydrolase 31-like [Brachionus plicatilis]|uniref:ubiquitinyl hydrolase 1 n=1 Tax=Brachionus plicatilis TaxID=10195 RepID=A0A3M7RIN5_BRAPC|nr:ubiquitin carboxyl-terminal hydrolase 31-like [Brachionus plicatilis]